MTKFEKQTDGTLVELNQLGVFMGYDDSNVPVYVPVVQARIPDPLPATTPGAPSATGVMLSRTSAKIDWTPAAHVPGSAPVTAWRVYKDGVQVGSDLTAGVLTLTITGLATDTPEVIFAFMVRGVSADGQGSSSNTVTLQWAGSQVSMPTAPSLFARGVAGETQVAFTWAETSDATIDKHGLFEGNTLVRDNISASARAYTYAGLTPGSAHTNVNIRRHNSAGWSPASNQLTFTMASGGVTPVTQRPIQGTDTEGPNDNYFTNWKATRVYNTNDAIAAVTNMPSLEVVAVTHDPNWPANGGATVATLIRNLCISFYEGSGSGARAGVELHIALRNEEDSEYKTGSLPTAVVTTHQLVYQAIHEETSPGVRRFPNASCWVDMTTYQIRTQGAGPRFKVIAPYLDGFACSMYPSGRDKDPIIWTDYDDYCAAIFDTLEDWRTVNPNLNQFATWEIGSPIDHALDNGGPNNLGTTNWSIRPRYFAGGRASGPTAVSATQPMGSNYEGYLNYVYRQCVERNIVMREQLYWNRQSNPTIPNPFKHDRNPTEQTASVDTATAWHNWTPGSRLADL